MADILKQLTEYRIKGIEKAEVEYYQALTRTLDKIEAQVVALADRELPRQAGKLIELQSAVAIRPKIKAILDREYLPFADRVVRKGFGEQAKRIERQFKTIGLIPPEFQELTKGDLALVKNLKQQYYTQFKDVSNNFTRVLSDKVYQNTLVGSEFTVLEDELRQSINGIYSTSRDPAVNRLVDYVKNNQDNPALASRVDNAIKILQTKYASTRVGENMKRYAGQILNDSLRDFDATLNFNKSQDAGLTYVKYYGDVIPTTRDHCRNMINGVYDRRESGLFTIDEINEIWANRSWKGKKGGNPMIVRGGYNCRHQFSYVNPDWYEEDGEQSNILEEVAPIIKKESKDIYGELGELERNLVEESFGKERTPYSNAIRLLAPIKSILRTKGKSPYYGASSGDVLELGVQSSQNARQLTMIHEYTHRIDIKLSEYLLNNPNKRKIVLKGFDIPTGITTKKASDKILSSYNIKNMIDDDKILSRNYSKNKLKYETQLKNIQKNAPELVVDGKINPLYNEYYKKQNSLIKSDILTDDEIKYYLKNNSLSDNDSAVLNFKLKLNNKFIDNTSKNYDYQFSETFNDYVGSITKESLGYGHGADYYNKFGFLESSGTKTFTQGQSLEAWAEHSSMSINPIKEMTVIERKLMNYYAPNTTKGFDTLVQRIGEIDG
jgi:hypothetical protein